MALKEEKVSVTSGKASVRKETVAVSGMRVTTVPKNQTTMPPHLPSHPCHEVEVCRGREVSMAKVTVLLMPMDLLQLHAAIFYNSDCNAGLNLMYAGGGFFLGTLGRPPRDRPPPDRPPPDRPTFRSFFFFLSRLHFRSFSLSLSLGSSRGILVVFLKAGTLKCARLGSRAVV